MGNAGSSDDNEAVRLAKLERQLSSPLESSRDVTVDEVIQLFQFRGEWADHPEKEGLDNLKRCIVDPMKIVENLRRITVKIVQDGEWRKSYACFRRPHHSYDATMFVFDLKDAKDREAAMMASLLDKRIGKAKPQLVPKEVSEDAFFRNYFTHVARLRKLIVNKAEVDLFPSGTNVQSRFAIGSEKYISTNPYLNAHCYESREEFAQHVSFISNFQERPVATKTKNDNENDEEGADDAARKKVVMELLKFSQPTVLSVLLEESNKDVHVPLDGEFWSNLYETIQGFSRHVETFTDVPVLEIDPGMDLTLLLHKVDFNLERDRKALEAAWEIDAQLPVAFRELIPQFLTKNVFWVHYFQHVAVLAVETFANTKQQVINNETTD